MRNELIVTSNNNIAWHLQQYETNQQLHPPKSVWAPRSVISLENWYNELGQAILRDSIWEGWRILSPVQEQLLWQQIVEASEREKSPNHRLMNPVAVAQALSKSWRNLRRYNCLDSLALPAQLKLSLPHLGRVYWTNLEHADSGYYLDLLNSSAPLEHDARLSLEFASLVRWQREFRQRCAKNKWLDSAALPTLISAYIADDRWRQHLNLPDAIIAYAMIGISDATSIDALRETADAEIIAPQEITLFQSLHDHGCQVSFCQDLASLYPQAQQALPLSNPERAQQGCRFICQVQVPSSSTASESGADQVCTPLITSSSELDDEHPAASLSSVYDKIEQEFQAIAQQVKELHGQDPESRIAILVPDLEDYITPLTEALDDALCPQVLLPSHSREQRPYTVSLGQTLDRIPLISSALNFLTLIVDKLSRAQATVLINSPYFLNQKSNLGHRARLDKALRSTHKRFITLDMLCQKAYEVSKDAQNNAEANETSNDEGTKEFPIWSKNIYRIYNSLSSSTGHITDDKDNNGCAELTDTPTAQFEQAVEDKQDKTAQPIIDLRQKRSYSAWVDLFNGWLKTMHWPRIAGQRMSKTEGRLLQGWHDILRTLSDLDVIAEEPVSCEEALNQLLELCHCSTVQTTFSNRANVHVCGLLEAIGLQFDQVFLVNYSNHSWPSFAPSLAFLPRDLQADLKMPNSTPEINQKLCHWINRRLNALAPKGVISFAKIEQQDKTIRTLQLSEMVRGLNCTFSYQEPYLRQPEDWYHQLLSHISSCDSTESTESQRYLEFYPNDPTKSSESLVTKLPPVGKLLHHGTSLLENQGKCPFKALVKARWLGDTMEEQQDSPASLEIGLTVHAILQGVWEKLKNNQNLHELLHMGAAIIAKGGDHRNTPLFELILDITKHTLEQMQEQRHDFGSDYFAAETERLARQIYCWFYDVEIKRHQKGLGFYFESPERGDKTVTDSAKPFDKTFEDPSLKYLLDHKDELAEYEVKCEQENCYTFGKTDEPGQSLTIKGRIDRLDVFSAAEGSIESSYISDYKTSDKDIMDWFTRPGERYPRSLQLPFYALYLHNTFGNQALRGLGYDLLKRKIDDQGHTTNRNIGIEAETTNEPSATGDGMSWKFMSIPNVNNIDLGGKTKLKDMRQAIPSLDEMVLYWEYEMGSLAQEFIAGLHPPIENNCTECELQHLCRRLHQPTDDNTDNESSYDD